MRLKFLQLDGVGTTSSGETNKTAYYEATHLICTCLKSRFDQGTLKFLSQVQNIILTAANGRVESFRALNKWAEA